MRPSAGVALDRRRALGPDHLGITVGPPRIGLAATIGTIIALNLGVAALIDRFGWFGYDRIPIGWARILGLVLLAAGAALSLRKSA
jgi:transporter family-2 protein